MDTESELSNQTISHKSEKRKSHSIKFKKDVVKYAKENSNNSAAKKIKVDRKRVCGWIQNGNKLLPMKGSRCRLDSREGKLTDVELDEQVLRWLHE